MPSTAVQPRNLHQRAAQFVVAGGFLDRREQVWEPPAESGSQRGRRHRLAEVTVHAGVEATLAILGKGIGRQGDDRRIAVSRLRKVSRLDWRISSSELA